MNNIRSFFTLFLLCFVAFSNAQNPNLNYSKFKQLKEELPTPNDYRTASGAPGHEYYQQKADYKINVVLDETNLTVSGDEIVTYTNNSPDNLEYLWLQLDQNIRATDADKFAIQTNTIKSSMTNSKLQALEPSFDGGYNLTYVKDVNNKDLPYIVNKTMMRIDLPKPLASGEQFSFKIKWWYNLNDRLKLGGRSGYELFPEENNHIFIIGQFFPRMAVYNDVEGWQHKQFLGSGEFALPFGDYEVNITVPDDHLVGATGVLQNPNKVLTEKQRNLLEKAKTSEEPVLIVNETEAIRNEKLRANSRKTWTFKAQNVRDFAWTSSRKFIWDAWGVKIGDKTVMAMSLYPKEGNPLWGNISTKLIAHTLKTYSDYTFEYPYPVAWSVNSKKIGMEFPMICFNWGRCESDGTYTEKTKYNTIRVIIHEIGHNYFPMIVNTDERQWAWMDEGLNSYVQFITEQKYQPNYPSARGYPYKAINYMKGDKSNMMPLMTNPESIPNLGANAYTKASVALNILRETILGRELFDKAFKIFAERWKFKHPTPADFFRTIEDASGTDLDWFWRGWFYTTDHVDMALEDVKWFKIGNGDPENESLTARLNDANKKRNITNIRDKKSKKETYVEVDKSLQDFYYTYDKFEVDPNDKLGHSHFLQILTAEERAILNADKNYYELKFSNVGGLVMPLIIEFEFKSGNKEIIRIPAEIWRLGKTSVSKVFVFNEEVENITLDPFRETADTDLENNFWPPKQLPTRFDLYINKSSSKPLNPMQKKYK